MSSRELTPELLADLATLSDPQVNPNGEAVAVVTAQQSRPTTERTALIRIYHVADGSERTISTPGFRSVHPRWSPDGRRLAFLSDRDKRDVTQILLVESGGGESRPLTSFDGGVSTFAWVDNDTMAVVATDASDEETKKRRDDRDDSNEWGAFWPMGRLHIIKVADSDARPIDLGERHVVSVVPSSDGQRLAVILGPNPDLDAYLSKATLHVVEIESGTVTDIASGIGPIDSVAWSGDGQTLTLIGNSSLTSLVGSNQLFSIPADGTGQLTRFDPDATFCYNAVLGGERLLTNIASGVTSRIDAVDLASNEQSTVLDFDGNITEITTAGDTIAFIGSTADRANELFVLDNGTPRRLSDLNAASAEVPLGHQEVLRWQRDGVDLDAILIWPPGKSVKDGPLPTVLSIHGGPYGRWPNGYQNNPFGRWIASQGYLVVMPNPRGGSGHGAWFAESVKDTVGNEDYLDIISAVDECVRLGYADPDRLALGGWSQGGFMTAWIVGHTDRFRAGVMGAGVSDWGMMLATSDIPSFEWHMGGGNPYDGVGPHSFDAQSPASFVSQVKTPVLIVHGEEDARVPYSQAVHFHRGLMHYDVETKLVGYPREPHGLQERLHQIDLLQRIAAWLQRWNPTD